MYLTERYTGLTYTYNLEGTPEYAVDVPAGIYDIYFRLNYTGVVDGGITDWTRLQDCAQIQ